MTAHTPEALTEESLASALSCLTGQDADLARVVQASGPPPTWPRPAGFPTLIHLILEQQVSLASARAAYERLLAMASPLTPERFLALDDGALRGAGFSRQKAAYGRQLAQAVRDGRLDLAALAGMSDEQVRAELIRIKGIGPWTADVYLLLALRRPDVWPKTDLALLAALREVKNLPAALSPAEVEAIGALWRPWRSVATRILWHHYLSKRGRSDE